jgi:hypothetical protein
MERYLGAINLLNNRTPYLAQISELLMTLKIELMRHIPKKKGKERVRMVTSIPIPAGGLIEAAFDNI